MTTAYCSQIGFRGRNDDVVLNSTAWTHAVNTNFTQDADQNFRIRFELEEQNTKNFSFLGSLEYSRNGGAWTAITAASAVIKSSLSTQFVDGDATTNLLTGSARTFVAGTGDENGAVGTISLNNSHTEHEYSLQIVGADVIDADTIQIRAAGLSAWSVTPTITVNIAVNNDIVSKDLSGAPGTIDTPVLDQNIMAALEITSAAPTIDTPVLGQPGAAIWDYDFEGGNFDGLWGQISDDITINTGSALGNTVYGLNVLVNDLNDNYIYPYTLDPVNSSGIWRYRFYFDPNSITMPTANKMTIFTLRGGGAGISAVALTYTTAAGYGVELNLLTDVGDIFTAWFPITDAPHFAEVLVVRATTVSSADGYATLWVDGTETASITARDNYDTCASVNSWRAGAVGKDSGASGTFYLDEIVINDTGDLIGSIDPIVDNDMVAIKITLGTPVVDSPELVQNSLVAQGISSTTAVDSPTLILTQAVVTNDLTAGIATIDFPDLGQNALVSADLTAGIVTIDSPDLILTQAVVTIDLFAGITTIDTPVLLQNALVAKNLISAPITISPAEINLDQNWMVAKEIDSGTPTIDTPVLFVTQAIITNDLLAGIAVIDKPVADQPAQNDMAAQDLLAGIAVIDLPILAVIQNVATTDLYSGIPTIDLPIADQPEQNIIAKDLYSGIPVIDLPILWLTQNIITIDLTGGIPAIDFPVLTQNYMVPQEIYFGTPTVESPILAQNYLAANEIYAGAPFIDQPVLLQSDYPIAFGEQFPTTESPVPWTTWSDGAAQIPDLVGGGYGQMELRPGDQGRSPVYNLNELTNWDFEIVVDQYGTGIGVYTLEIRGSSTLFLQDDTAPAWESYSSGVIKREWQYVQIRAFRESVPQECTAKDLRSAPVTVDKPILSQGVIYYVDSISGLDTNTGLSEGQAWKTLAKVNGFAFAPGSNILFKRDQTFTGILRPTASGSAGNYIRFGAYGIGSRPIITHGTNFTSCYPETPFLRFDELDFSGSNASNYSSVMAVMHDLYFYDCIFRDGLYMGFQAWTNDGSNMYNIIVDGCEAFNNAASGIVISSNLGIIAPYDCEVKNCIAHDNGTALWADHGIYCRYGVSIHDNICYNNPVGGGIKVNNEGVVTALFPMVYNNICYGNFIGIYAVHTNALIYNNLIYANTIGMNLDADSTNMLVVFNTFINALNVTDGMLMRIDTQTMSGSTFKNNIFVQDRALAAKMVWRGTGISSLQNLVANNILDKNAYYTDGNISTLIMQDSDQSINWTQWKALTGTPDVNSTFLTSLPNFVTRYTDLHPIESGNLDGLGVAIVGYGIDLDNVSRADPPTPGCYEPTGSA